ncbi:MAG: hypothetical protein K2X45_07985 [Phreatobacter sp.]|nr:hypothetical protein [Phreatobacter sp.]
MTKRDESAVLTRNVPDGQTPAKAKALKAYAVTEPDEGMGGIVFATSARDARRLGASMYSDGDPESVESTRAPWADEFAATGIVPAKAMVAAGWWLEDHWTGLKIDLDYLDEVGLTIDDVIGTQGGPAFACEAHAKAYAAREARRAFARALALADLKALLAKELPGATLVTGRYSEHWHGKDIGTRFLTAEARLHFTFPGQKIGAAKLRIDEGVMRPYVTCCNGDIEAFRAFLKDQPITNIRSAIHVD